MFVKYVGWIFDDFYLLYIGYVDWYVGDFGVVDVVGGGVGYCVYCCY